MKLTRDYHPRTMEKNRNPRKDELVKQAESLLKRRGGESTGRGRKF